MLVVEVGRGGGVCLCDVRTFGASSGSVDGEIPRRQTGGFLLID
jgi:hypothetical protein